MEFFDYLLETFGENEVILLNEIKYKEYSLPWIKKAVAELCKDGKLVHFEKGVYYIPTNTILGKSRLDLKKVIRKKYINDGEKYIGYYSGVTFLNMLGLSTQIPNIPEIYTNNEPSRIREVSVGNGHVLLRRARAKINNENVATMSFLEMMNFTDASFYDDEKRKIISEYIIQNRITRKSIAQCSPYFPDKAMRTLIESGVIYAVTQ